MGSTKGALLVYKIYLYQIPPTIFAPRWLKEEVYIQHLIENSTKRPPLIDTLIKNTRHVEDYFNFRAETFETAAYKFKWKGSIDEGLFVSALPDAYTVGGRKLVQTIGWNTLEFPEKSFIASKVEMPWLDK
jgi:hypothetical protein